VRPHLLDAASHRYRDSDIFSGVVKASVPSLAEAGLRSNQASNPSGD
jgi:hypothetical protein